MRFGVIAYDSAINITGNDPAGVEKIRIDFTGPCPSATLQVDSATLCILTQFGTWKGAKVEVFNGASNSTLYNRSDLSVYPAEKLSSTIYAGITNQPYLLKLSSEACRQSNVKIILLR
jgi:hypothetical protein